MKQSKLISSVLPYSFRKHFLEVWMFRIRRLGLFLSVIALQPALIALSYQSGTALTPSANTLVSPSINPDPHDEPSIAISQVNSNIIVAASNVIAGGAANPFSGTNQVAYYFSSDGGATWGAGLLSLQAPEETFAIASHPFVASDSQGNFYVAALLNQGAGSGTGDAGIYVFESTNQGQTFSQPITVFASIADPSPKVLFQPTLAIDTMATSPFRDTVYVAWMGNYSTDAGVRFAFKRPGDSQFSVQQRISHSGNFDGPALATGPNGEVYGAWEGIGIPDHLYFNGSTDGGASFFSDIGTTPSVDFPAHVYIGSLTNQPSFVPGFSNANSFPTLDVDRSSGPNRGRIYIAWAETLNNINSDIFMLTMAPPNGSIPTPTSPIAVGPSGLDQFFPHLSVDPSSGTVSVAFYDQADGGGSSVNTFLALSNDGGNTFPENIRMSSVASPPNVQSNIEGQAGTIGFGIYLGLESLCGQSRVAWTDTRDGKQEIFYSSVTFNSSLTCGTAVSPGPPNDNCASPQALTSLPVTATVDTTSATSEPGDPVLCSGSAGSNTVWYSLTVPADTSIGVDTSGSNYDTVLGVFTGSCGSLSTVTCNDDFGNTIGNGSLLVFKAQAGVNYLIEVAGKGSGGALDLRVAFPTVTSVQYTPGPNGNPSLEITGASFVQDNAQATVQIAGVSTVLPKAFFQGSPQADGTATSFFAAKNKLKKLIKPGVPVTVTVESPIGSGRLSVPFSFTR
jgi:hypothetical protein